MCKILCLLIMTQFLSHLNSLQLQIEKLQIDKKIRDEWIKEIEGKLQAKHDENERLKETNRKLLEVMTISPDSKVRPANHRMGEITFMML